MSARTKRFDPSTFRRIVIYSLALMTETKRTKIVATIGPASDSEEKIADLIKAGVNVFRFNMKHGDLDWHNERITKVKKISDALYEPIGILIDLQGPEIRLYTKNGDNITLRKGQTVVVSQDEANKDALIKLSHDEVAPSLKVGDQFLIDDAFVEMKVVAKDKSSITLEALNDCVIKNKKGVNLPGIDIDLPSLIEDDLKKLDLASKNIVDFIALSFVRTKKDIDILRNEMLKRKISAKIVAKIENQKALDNLEELILASDAVMIARGDLGVETPIEQLAYWQKRMVNLCRTHHRPVIVATQMLESMTNNPRPTRAEATDVANAILDGTDAIMLSGETAGGKFPVKAVEAMAKIAKYNEQYAQPAKIANHPITSADLIVDAVSGMFNSGKKIDVDLIVIFTETGHTARMIASRHLPIPVMAITDNEKTMSSLILSYGVMPIFEDFPSGVFHSSEDVIKKLENEKILITGQKILVVHGKHWKTPGLTNSLSIIEV